MAATSTTDNKAADNKAADKAINDINSTLASMSINDNAATESKAADIANEAAQQSAAEGRRLYIGNLAYATQESQLKEFFADYKVESIAIPKNPRTERPVGYAFVDISSSAEAQRAISELTGKEILERKVSVQLARKPDAPGEKTEGDGEGNRRRGFSRGSRARGRGRGGRTGRAGRADNMDHNHEKREAEGETQNQPLTDITNQATGDKTRAGKPLTPRPQRKERGPPADGIPSKTKIMVANLPYDLSEEKLKEIFVAFEPSTAKIALRPIPRYMIKKLQARNEPRKGRGFGFVTLASEEMQQKAVAEMNGKEIDGREIAVKVAIDSPDKMDDENGHPQGEENETATADAEQTAAPPVTAMS